MNARRDDVEERLTALFHEQAASIPDGAPAWAGLATGAPQPSRPPRQRVLALATAVLVLGAGAVVVGRAATRTEHVGTVPAASDDGEGTPPAGGGRVVLETRQVSLAADAVTIHTGGRRFDTVPGMDVWSDPGTRDEYTTLEATWQEHDVEMRLFVYFRSDGREWWSDEIRTYDGRDPGEWIVYRGDFFRRPLGSAYVGDFSAAAPGPSVGRLVLSNLRLEAFRRPAACEEPSGPLALDPVASPVRLRGSGELYGAGVELLETDTCTVVHDGGQFGYEWRSADPQVVEVVGGDAGRPGAPTTRADLRSVGGGRTVVHVTARAPGTGAVVAEAEIVVIVEARGDRPTTSP